MDNTKALEVCQHGGLRRQCEVCERNDEIADLRAQLAERDAQLAAYQWQPIETAPKDGTLILTAEVGDRTWTPVVARWGSTFFCGSGWCINNRLNQSHEPNFWCHLIEPKTQNNGQSH